MSNNNIEIHSEEVREIMGEIPSWTIRWGLTVIFSIFGILILGSYLFKHHQIINAPVLLTTLNPPLKLEVKVNGKIEKLFVDDGDFVEPMKEVALIKSQTNYNDLLLLENELLKYMGLVEWESEVLKGKRRQINTLGEVQNSYTQFQKNWNQFNNYLVLDHINKKIELLEKQIIKQDEYYEKILENYDYLKQELKLSRTSYKRDSFMYALGTYSLTLVEYERSKQTFLQKQSSFVTFEASLKNTESSILSLQENKIELQQQYQKELDQYRLTMSESFQLLLASIKQWKDKYLIVSEIKGKVTLTEYWSENQVINAGENIATIVPIDETEIIGKLTIPTSGFGKVEVGQNVHIKLSGFPYMEFGALKGRIKSVSLVPEEQGYIAEVELPDGMTTSYSETLRFIQEMDGTAEIITKETRLIYRFINPLRSMINNGN